MKIIINFGILVPILSGLSFFATAQFYEDFSSEDLSTNQWQGNTDRFKFSSTSAIPANMQPALQIDDVIENTSYLAAPYSLTFTDSVEWSFWIKLSFNPTAGNHSRVYIASDQANITDVLNGYFIGVGETNDRITLSKQNGAIIETLITGNIANLNKTLNVVRIKVIRNDTGFWKVYSDTLGGTNFALEGTIVDNQFGNSNWHGLYCKYTSSNATKIYFDEFYAGTVQIDTIKPTVENINTFTQSQLQITFSEPVDISTVFNKNNYSVNHNIGNPVDIWQDDPANHPLCYDYSFFPPFPENIPCLITIKNIKDLADNIIDSISIPFAYYKPKPFDIVINEIMADPTPVVGLPEYEYVELYNKTNLPINLNNWTIKFGTTVRTFANVTILPDSFLIICGSSAKPFLAPYGQVYDFSSVSLTNEGMAIVLNLPNNNIIHAVSYTDEWYQDLNKKDGGWSLEMIDPNNPCQEMENWRASVSSQGGTPGQQNSIYAQNSDNTEPQLVRIATIDSVTIQVYFSESMDSTTLANTNNYSFNYGLQISSAPVPVGPHYKSVKLKLTPAMQPTVVYTLTVIDSIIDCAGNIVQIQSKAKFALSETIEQDNIVVNEILSNPPTGLKEFVEIYNNSEKILDLKDMFLATIDKNTGFVTTIKTISEDGFLFFPQDHIVLSTDADAIISHYYCPYPNNFIEMSSFPQYNNDEGAVILIHKNSTIIDRVDYDVSMHFPLLNTTKGVSLERVNYNRPSYEKTNWQSASENAGFATPGYKNSQYSDIIATDEITIYPEIFSPDNDGYNDLLHISYEFPEPGYVGSVTIFDSNGRLIKNLVQNKLLGTSGTYTWNGITNDYQKANIGIYIIFIEVFDIHGNTKTYKKTAVLASRLN